MCKRCNSDRNRAAQTAARIDAIEAYGGVCQCCGESNQAFLVIDHTDGGGSNHRKEIGPGGQTFYRWLRRNQYPTGFQVLCANCNMAKERYGGCPHATPAYC